MHIDRNSHLAARNRKYLSSVGKIVFQLLSKNPRLSHLDYGCGLGGDVKILRSKGFNSVGYDPYYFPECPAGKFDLVTCGFVLNTQSTRSRRETIIKEAFAKCRYPNSLIIASLFQTFTYAEFRAMVEICTGYYVEAVDRPNGILRTSNIPIISLDRTETESAIATIKESGWVAPLGTNIKGYCTGFDVAKGINHRKNFGLWAANRYFRLSHPEKVLPSANGNLVSKVHLGKDKDCEKYKWAEAGLLRRNQILQLKFRCNDYSYLSEFSNFRKWELLNPNWKPNPDPLGQPDSTRKDKRLAPPQFTVYQKE